MNHGTNCYLNGGLRFFFETAEVKAFFSSAVFTPASPLAIEVQKISRQFQEGFSEINMLGDGREVNSMMLLNLLTRS